MLNYNFSKDLVFLGPMIPPGYRATAVHGFVEELVVNDDPEYQWIDKIRTPRASNEARQAAFIKLSNQVIHMFVCVCVNMYVIRDRERKISCVCV